MLDKSYILVFNFYLKNYNVKAAAKNMLKWFYILIFAIYL